MRMMLKASIPVESGNAAIANGTMGQTIQTILQELKPEAAYFTTDESGRRTAYLFVNIANESEIVKVAEPFFLAMNAQVDLRPAMTPADLANAAPAMQQATAKYARAAGA